MSPPDADPHRATAAATRALLLRGGFSSGLSNGPSSVPSCVPSCVPSSAPARDDFRRALLAVPADQRDVWLDLVFGIEGLPEDGPELPRGCVPYLPCSVSALLRLIEHADVRSSDVFVDIGSGLGRATLLLHLLTGATTLGLEIQPHLVRAARELATRFHAPGCSAIVGDAPRLTADLARGTVFLLYCPFSGERLAQLLGALEPIAQTRPLRICTIDLPLPPRPWLTQLALPFEDLAIYRSM